MDVKALPVLTCCAPIAGPTLSDDDARELERLFRALGDRHRVRILNVLVQAGGEQVCVCEFVPLLGLKQPTVSYHLKQLVDVGLLERERRGTFAFYRLAPDMLERLGDLFDSRESVEGGDTSSPSGNHVVTRGGATLTV